MRDTSPRIYVAAPVGVLCRSDWPLVIGRVTDLVGPVWDPAVLFHSSADWIHQWPTLLPRVRSLVLVPDDDGSIGAGCLREIADVFGSEKVVQVYIEGRLVPWGEVVIRPVPAPSRFCGSRPSAVGTREGGPIDDHPL